jgi:purine-nucleoside phosphorylase
MSTVPEVTVVRQCGIRCFGLSLVTNKCVIDENTDEVANHEEVLETGRMRSKDTQNLVCSMVGALSSQDLEENNNQPDM